MDKLISAERLKAHYCWWQDEKKKLFDTIIDLQPRVDAVSVEDYRSMEQTVHKLTQAINEGVRHGHWITEHNPMRYQTVPYVKVCSECGTAFPYATPYCGECGAKMDEGQGTGYEVKDGVRIVI